MVTQGPGPSNVPGMSFGRPGELAQPVRAVTARRVMPIGLAGIGKSPYAEIQTAYLGEDGLLVNETQIQVATCAGMGDLIKSEAEAGSMCMFHGFILCTYCAPRFRCACGRQTCARCAQKSGESAVCPICQGKSQIGGSAWNSTRGWELGPGSQAWSVPTWEGIPSTYQWGT